MAKIYNTRFVITCFTLPEEGVGFDVPSDERYFVRALGRGRWFVEDEDGYRCRVLRTAELQRFIRGLRRRYIGDYWSSGEPQYYVSDVYVTRV